VELLYADDQGRVARASLSFHKDLSGSSPGTLMMFHRADFQRVLLRTLPNSCKTHYSKRLRSYKQRLSGPIEVLFEDGSTTTCDVLIGADGLKSAVRRTFLAEKAVWAKSEKRTAEVANINASVDPVWSGTNAYRALIPAERLRERAPDHQVFREPTQVSRQPAYSLLVQYGCSLSRF
jgi:salicylate hydroxylase